MEKSTEPQPCTQWFVFFKDQLLLKKGYTDKGEIKYSVPVSIEPPLTPEAGSNIHEVFPPNGKQVRAFALEQPVAETDEWVMIGLRASYDYISPDEYRSAGKAFQILYWDEHSRFCPVCGTAMEHQTPIMKKCPNCGNEMYPPVSTAIIVLIRKGDEILLVHARNFRGTFYGLVAGFLEAGETLEECVEREVFEETEKLNKTAKGPLVKGGCPRSGLGDSDGRRGSGLLPESPPESLRPPTASTSL